MGISLLNSNFTSNIGEKGVIYHKKCEISKLSENNLFYGNRFENNVARQYGGVFYYDHNESKETFNNCIFYNNTAPIGT